MTVLRLIIAAVLMLIAAYIVLMNWGCVIVSIRNKRREVAKHHSTVPLVTLIIAYLIYLAYPYKPDFWIGLIPALDIGNWFLLYLPVVLWRESRKK